MLLKVFATLFIISLGMIVFGLLQYFTVTWGDKWYPGLDFAFFKILSDKGALKSIFYGIVLLLFTAILGAILKL